MRVVTGVFPLLLTGLSTTGAGSGSVTGSGSGSGAGAGSGAAITSEKAAQFKNTASHSGAYRRVSVINNEVLLYIGTNYINTIFSR